MRYYYRNVDCMLPSMRISVLSISIIWKSPVLLFLIGILLFLASCGTLTGIPGHGGGKRFAVEQELIAATTRSTLKQIDLTSLKGKKVNIFLNSIGDTGVGNLLGGRLSLVSELRGNYIQSPSVTERYSYPRYISNTNSTTQEETSIANSDSNSTSSMASTTESLLAAPDWKKAEQSGSGMDLQVGTEYKGLGTYQNSDRVSSDDIQYLFGLTQTYFFLKDVYVVPPSEAEIDVYVIVDVFGTIRSRIDWFFANNEILRAKTSLEILAVDHQTGKLVMPPQIAVSEAEYNEQYVLWMGPVSIKKFIQKTDPLLCDFTDIPSQTESVKMPEQDGQIPYPFKFQIDRWLEEE